MCKHLSPGAKSESHAYNNPKIIQQKLQKAHKHTHACP